ncbi:MAG: glycosyl hydrolase family 18 protein [Gemmatimonadales bacterium]
MRARGSMGFLGALVLLAAARATDAQKPEALWYARGELSVQSFLAHADQISIVSPQVFKFDRAGTITGSVDRRIIDKAREKGVKLVPLVMNAGFDQPTIHRILTVREARHRAIRSLAALCRDNHFAGIQFDIENVHISDKDALTSFVRESVDSVHRAGCTLSAAVVPRTGEDPGPTSYHKWIFDNWRGAYDYKALADTLDFISYMTYAQHTGNTPAGPVAGFPWMEECLKYVLSLGVAPSKISLGVPGYSDWWYPVWEDKAGPRMRGRDIPFVRAESVLARSGVHAVWDDVQKAPYAGWDERGVYQYAWMEDARAFVTKMGLVSRYHLRGYSVWVLGSEDPKTWAAISAAPR